MNESFDLAKKAVLDGDNTLKKAQHTYDLLQRFSTEVQDSSETAKIALEKVPDIIEKVQQTEKLIAEAENVKKIEFSVIFSILIDFGYPQALDESYNNANSAKKNAHDAQVLYASQASTVKITKKYFQKKNLIDL